MWGEMMCDALVIGAGPAGLMAAEVLATAGRRVVIADAKPSFGRKFLMAGKSGLNLTMNQPVDVFTQGITPAGWMAPIVQAFGPEDVAHWARGLGQELFIGSTGRVFPKTMKASPLLRAWLGRLADLGAEFRTRWRWQGYQDGQFVFDTPQGVQTVRADTTILALGGASWPRLGSDGGWTAILAAQAVPLMPFRPSNMGFCVKWSAHMAQHFGQPVKAVALRAGDVQGRGECVITASGLEGGGIYTVSAAMRDGAQLQMDLVPDLSLDAVIGRLSRGRGGDSLPNYLRKTLRLDPLKIALLQECARPLPVQPYALAAVIKGLTIAVQGAYPMEHAISTVGGIARSGVDDGLQLRAMPGVFASGEMLDWDAPTGGYLLTTCLATGRWAARSALGG